MICEDIKLKLWECKAKILAKNQGIPFYIRCKITYEKNNPYTNIDLNKINGKFNIYIPIHKLKSNDEILVSIFHEYGHHIYNNTDKIKLKILKIYYDENNYIRFHDDKQCTDEERFEEDFCETFGRIVCFGFKPKDEEISHLINNIISIGISKISKI